MKIINTFIETLNPKTTELIILLFTTTTGYVIIGIIFLISLIIIKYHELVEGTKCYSALLPIPIIREYFLIKLTSGKTFGRLYVITYICTTIINLLPIKNINIDKGLNILKTGLTIFLLINIIVGLFKFLYLYIKEKRVNIKYQKMEKEIKRKQQKEIKQEQINDNHTKATITNTLTPNSFNEDLSFKPNNNIKINNKEQK